MPRAYVLVLTLSCERGVAYIRALKGRGYKRLLIKGLAEPRNPGHGIWAFSVISTIGREYYHDAGYIGDGVSNYLAEYRALIEALRYCQKRDLSGVIVRTGLNVIVRQVSKQWGVADNLAPYCQEARMLLDKTSCSVEWQENSRDNFASMRAKAAYWQAQSGELKPEPLVLLTSPALAASDQDGQLQLPLFG